MLVADETTQAATIERLIRPQAIALALFALALALTALLIVGQVAARTLQTAAQDNGTLAALGMTRRQLFTASVAETAAAAVAGALGAVAIAIAASPLTPIGPARLAEPHPGVSVNAGVLAAGAAAIVVLLAARVAVPAWRQAGARPAAEPSVRRPLLAEELSRVGAPLAAVTGVRFALDAGSGRASVPVRSAMLGLAIAVAAVAAAGTFGANLLRLVGTPSLYGQDWNIAFEGQFGTVTAKQFTQITAHVPGITDVTYGVHGTVTIGKTVIPAIGLAPGTGPMTSSTVITGRPPATAGQIALGGSVLRQLGLRVGQTVTVSTPVGTRPMLITGSAVFPYFGQGGFTPTDAGEGAETTAAVLQPLANAGGSGAGGYNVALVSFAPGPARQADIAAFQRAWSSFCAHIGQTTCIVTDQRPNTVTNYAAIDATPEILAGVLAVLGLAVLAQFILASAHRRRRDFALLKVLGMFRRDLSAVAFWQVATVTAVALVVGVPLGIAGGRWAWQLFADQAGLPTDAITSLPVLWMIPATLLVAALVALPPARSVASVPGSRHPTFRIKTIPIPNVSGRLPGATAFPVRARCHIRPALWWTMSHPPRSGWSRRGPTRRGARRRGGGGGPAGPGGDEVGECEGDRDGEQHRRLVKADCGDDFSRGTPAGTSVCGLPQNAVVVGTPTRARHPPTGRPGSPLRCAYVRCRAARRAQAARRLARAGPPSRSSSPSRAAPCWPPRQGRAAPTPPTRGSSRSPVPRTCSSRRRGTAPPDTTPRSARCPAWRLPPR